MTSAHPARDIRIFHKEAKSLARAGYSIALVAPHARDEEDGGVRILSVPPAGGSRLLRATFCAFRIWLKALETKARMFHFHDPELVIVGLLLRAARKPVVYDVHEDLPETIGAKEYIPRFLHSAVALIANLIEKTAARFFSAIVTVTPALHDKFQRYNRNVITVCNFPDPEEYSVMCDGGWDQRGNDVAYLGVISENRGLRRMTEAIRLLPADMNASLLLTGHFATKSLETAARNLPGWNRIRYLGYLDRAGVIQVLGSVRAGLVLLDPEERFKVAYPIKMFEYMAAGIPVIASDFPLWRHIIAETGCGLMVDPMSPPAIAEAIKYILTHPREAEAMGRNGRDAVASKYNWNGESDKLLGLYRSLGIAPK